MDLKIALQIAKNNPGYIVKREPGGDGFMVLDRNRQPLKSTSYRKKKKPKSRRTPSGIAQTLKNINKQKQVAERYRRKLKVNNTGPKVAPDHKRYIDEGIAGTREDNRRTQGGNLSDIRNRNKEFP